MEFRTFVELKNTVTTKSSILPNDIDLIVGVPRSGLLPAYLLSLHKNLPFIDLDGFLQNRPVQGGQRVAGKTSRLPLLHHHALILDDSICYGGAMQEVKNKVSHLATNLKISYSAVYTSRKTHEEIDFGFEIVNHPRFFEWNFMHSNHLNNACVDIDGVLCHDPTTEEDDDGVKYIDFLLNATPLHVPTKRIDTIVSCRLEKFRPQTEQWLSQHQIQYKHLRLLDLPNKKSRMRWGKHGEYKANIYSESPNQIFIESSLRQAEVIANRSCKPVFCIENMQVIFPGTMDLARGLAEKTSRKLGRNRRFANSRIGQLIMKRLSYR